MSYALHHIRFAARLALVKLLLTSAIIAFAGDYEDGVAAINKGDYEVAYARFRQAAEHGHARAQSSLAAMHYSGLGVPKDQEQALYWYTKAAEQGHAEALGLKRRGRIALRKTPGVAPAASAKPSSLVGTGTGFYVSSTGHVLTNKHVISECSSLALEPIGKPIRAARVVATDSQNDFAILVSDAQSSRFARFRSSAVRQGEGVVVYGFPLPGSLASSGNATTGTVTALAGLQDDTRILQISAPVQPGNSGGPLMDMSGAVVGVVVAKLNAAKVMDAIGDIPQNVNFALKANIARGFLERHGINHQSVSRRGKDLSVPDVVDIARNVSVRVLCYR